MNSTLRNLLIWIVLALVLIKIMGGYTEQADIKSQVEYSSFIQDVEEKKVEEVVLQTEPVVTGYVVNGNRKDKSTFYTVAPNDQNLISTLLNNDVRVKVVPEQRAGLMKSILINSIPVLLLVLLWVYFMRRMHDGGGGGNGAFTFGKSRARLLDKDNNTITFDDVAGCDEAKEEIQEVVDYLRAPSKYQSLGGKVPKGILLYGSPGTGKTLLAKAVAGEAKVPFFSISGSDFVEMFVGVGASRVRDMFEQVKKSAPCILFIDEIDAVGRQRGSGLGGGSDEREQTLVQLLVEMDGFETNNTVIVIAATNRPDILDSALMRPGRFDRQIVVPLPDVRGREQILKVHIKKIKADDSVDVASLARGTPGFSGADLANLVNEAALFAGRKNKIRVDQSDFEEAKDKVYMGPERRSMVMHEDEKRATAYHESGHAVVAESLEGTDPVHKVTIVPRGRALGLTWQLPERDRISMYKQQLLNQICILFGGRIAEDLFVKKISTGASNDFERATKIAREMVTQYGMTDALGVMVYQQSETDEFLSGRKNISDKTMQRIDEEIFRILDEQYKKAENILRENADKVETMTNALMEWETIDRDQVLEIMAGKQPSPPKDYSHNYKTKEQIAEEEKEYESKALWNKDGTKKEDGGKDEKPKSRFFRGGEKDEAKKDAKGESDSKPESESKAESPESASKPEAKPEEKSEEKGEAQGKADDSSKDGEVPPPVEKAEAASEPEGQSEASADKGEEKPKDAEEAKNMEDKDEKGDKA